MTPLYTRLVEYATRLTPKWWQAARIGYRLAGLAATALESTLTRGDLPLYMRPHLEADVQALRGLIGAWRDEFNSYHSTPTLCPRCDAPRTSFDGGPCDKCPPEQRLQ